jgi:putative ABC transport system permease protein
MVITQQGAIFVGIMTRTVGTLADQGYQDIWVMDPEVKYIEDSKPLQDTALNRVRGVEGVAWAMPLFKGIVQVRLPDGSFQSANLLGLDDATLAGGPPWMVSGELRDLRSADAVIVDLAGATEKLAHPPPTGSPPGTLGRPLAVGDELEINDRRGVVVGICRTTRPWANLPQIFTTYSRAVQFAPQTRRMLTFIIVKAEPGENVSALADRISRQTGLLAYPTGEFKWLTVSYFLKNTGIPINFGIAVGLGFIIGASITGFMFYSFTADNIRYFGTLKAMGASDGSLMVMILAQSLVVALIGFGLGTGAAALFGASMKGTQLAFNLPWQLLVLSGAAVVIICMLSAMLSLRKVVSLEPAIVFKG